MIKANKTIMKVKEEISAMKLKSVAVKVNLGRNKYANYFGRITEVYPSLFTITPIDGWTGKTTYSYNELMCGNVSVKERIV